MELLSPLELSTGLQSKTINKILLCINKTIELTLIVKLFANSRINWYSDNATAKQSSYSGDVKEAIFIPSFNLPQTQEVQLSNCTTSFTNADQQELRTQTLSPSLFQLIYCAPVVFLPYSHIVSRYMAFPRSTATFGCFWSCSHYFLNRGSPCSRALGTSLHSLFKTTSGGTHSLRLMSSHSNGAESSSSHLERTEHSPRQEFLVQGTVTEMTQLSRTVKGLSIEVKDRRFSFKCGQWVDFFIPGVPTVGGFTICSSHRLLKEKRSIDLAVKHSEHPPALWVHTQCQVGSKVHMKVGGECYFDPNPEGSSPDLLLIAGGVGINPLYSIAQHVADISSDASHQYDGKTVLLFSAKNQDELLYKDNLLKMSEQCPSILCKFFVTKPDADTQTNVNSVQCERGRINESRLQEAVSSLDRNRLICYICGPPPMIQQITEILYKMDIEESRILFEKWW